MNIYLDNYNMGYKMAVVAKNEAVLKSLLEKNICCMYKSQNEIVFYPEGSKSHPNKAALNKVDKLENYDIVEISPNGILYRAYADKESDSTVFMGSKCNSNCIMCPAGDAERRKGGAYTKEQLETYISYLPDDVRFLILTGGEPTLNKDLFLFALQRIAYKFPAAQVLLLTNGRSLSNKEFCNQVVKVKPNKFRVAIPIHGANSNLHDYITRVPGSLEQTLSGIKRLLNKKIEVEVRIVVTQTNSLYLKEIVELIAKELPTVFCVNFVALEPRGNCAKNANEVYIDHPTSFKRSKAAIDLLISNGIDVGLYNYPLCSIDKGYWHLSSKSIARYKAEYHPDCEQCDAKEMCGGLFTATLKFIKPQVYPISLGK